MDDRIENISDQLDGYVEEIVSSILHLESAYKFSFDESAKIVELAIKDMHNDVLWNDPDL